MIEKWRLAQKCVWKNVHMYPTDNVEDQGCDGADEGEDDQEPAGGRVATDLKKHQLCDTPGK
jgi:hypothetical protein